MKEKSILSYLSVILACSLLLGPMMSCQRINPEFQAEAADPSYLHRSVKKLTDVIVHDIFSPPVASRIYAYPSIAAYEAIRHDHPEYQSLVGQINELNAMPQPEAGVEYCFPLAAVQAYLKTGTALIFSEEKMDAFAEEIMAEFQAIGMPEDVFDRSIAYGDALSAAMLAYANTDMYKETRTFPKFSLTEDPDRWQPTPPDYKDGIEPHWQEIRTMVLDSAQQFKPAPPTAFSLDSTSQFYEEVIEVYSALEAEDKEERIAIAEFWDCNPFVSHHKGHVMFATKKITPGGHWMGIVSIATKQTDADFMKTTEAYCLTSIALFDAFISCWDEKYRSRLVRPETYINRYLDEEWVPALQTPPFPEYTSGHSVISRASAIVLTDLFGDNFQFVDDTEVEYGLPERTFDSFLQASEEAAVSRLYGGIHYRPAIDEGVSQGEEVGKFILKNIELRKDQVSQQQ